MKKALYRTVTALSIKGVLAYILLSFIMVIPFSYFSSQRWAGAVGASIYATDVIASMLVFGIPFFLGVALLMRSIQHAEWEIELPVSSMDARKATLARYIVLVILTSLIMVIWTIICYGITMNMFPFTDFELFIAYLPGTIGAAVIVSSLLSALFIFLSTAVSSWKPSSITTVIFFILLWIGIGSSTYVSSFDTFAILSPFHLFRFLSLALSGYIVDPVMGTIWGDAGKVNMIFGIAFGPIDVLTSLIVWSIIAIVSLVLSARLMVRELTRLALETKLTKFEAADQPAHEKLKEISRSIRTSQQMLGIAFVLILILLPLLRVSVININTSENTQTLYESPDSGELLEVGVWRYGEVQISAPPSGLNNMYQLRIEIIHRDNCPEEMEAWIIFDSMTLTSFQSLNETQQDELVSTRHLSITPDRTSIGGGHSSIQTTGTHVWGIKFVPSDGGAEQGTLLVRISISIVSE